MVSFTTATEECNTSRSATPSDWPKPASLTRLAVGATPTTMPWPRASTASTRLQLIHRRGPWRNVEHVEWATLTYVDWFNNRRIHNEIGKIPPAEMEENYYRQIDPAELVASQTTESL